MTVKFLDLPMQYQTIASEMDSAIQKIVQTGAFIGGAAVKDFETAFASYHDAPYCIAVGNGTDALEIILEALDLPQGSEVLVPANSFIASSEAVTRAGLRVRFVDCDPATHLIDLKDAARKIGEKTCAIMAVHLYGQPCDMVALKKIAELHNLKIVEDCAQAHGAKDKGLSVGALGDAGSFSFYPGKNLGAYGDGGAILTRNEELAKRCRMIANHGRLAKYDHAFEGRNSRLDGLQAAVLSTKLPHLQAWTATRQKTAQTYLDGLSGIAGLSLPAQRKDAESVFHLFVIRSEKRDALKAYLAERDIQTGIHYPIALPKLEAYAYLGQAADCPVACAQDTTLLSLPIGDHMTPEMTQAVIDAVRSFFKG